MYPHRTKILSGLCHEVNREQFMAALQRFTKCPTEREEWISIFNQCEQVAALTDAFLMEVALSTRG